MTVTDTEVHTMVVHKMAAETIRDMNYHAQAVVEVWKHIDPDLAYKTIQSCSRQVSELFNMFFGQESRISRDGELSLFVSTASGFVFGVIFHPKHYRVDEPQDGDINLFGPKGKRTGRYCITQDDAGKPCGNPYSGGKVACEGQHPQVPAALPIPGEWSFHS